MFFIKPDKSSDPAFPWVKKIPT